MSKKAVYVVFQKIAYIFFIFHKTHPLASFLIRRFLAMLSLLFIIGFLVFALMSLAPGDIVDRYVVSYMLEDQNFRQSDNVYTSESIVIAKKRLGLDKPFYMQYFSWLKRVFVFHDLGRSLISRAPVLFLVSTRMRNSLVLNLISLFFLTLISFFLGIVFSSKAGTKIDIWVGITALFFHAFPGILLLILLQLFAAVSGWFPVTAYPSISASDGTVRFVFSYLYHIVLPLFGAFLSGVGGSMRIIRATMLDQLGMPYITVLRSRGISNKRIYFSHAFRNTLNPFITSSANLFASLFSGSLILEVIFSYPGIGRLMYEAVLMEDVNLVLANIMFISILSLLGILLSDMFLALLDPRIRYGATK